jgi:hypothetical protein
VIETRWQEKSNPSKRTKGTKAAKDIRSRIAPNAWQHSQARLQKNLPIGKRMKPYIVRMRLRVGDFNITDLRRRQRELTDILIRQKIPQATAKSAVAKILNLAADHQLQCLRRDRYLEDLELAKEAIKRLVSQFDHLVQRLSKLSPKSRGELNKIMNDQDFRHFDTETFAELIHSILHALPKLSPACVAQEARLAIIEMLPQASDDLASFVIIRTAPPAILDLWDSIPAETRTKVEEAIRSRSSCRSATDFFRYMATMLTKSSPQAKIGRRPSIERLFGQQVAKIWRGLGLHVGRAYNSGNRDQEPYHYPSTFQRFCQKALAVVGDNSRISGRQVLMLKRELQQITARGGVNG